MRLDIGALLKANGNSMEIDINGIPDLCAELSEDIQRFNKVDLKGKLVNMSGILAFKGILNFSYLARCGRCLEDALEDTSIEVEGEFISNTAEVEEKEYFFTGSELEFSRFILDNIALAIPVKHLCSDDCKGLCPSCGKNLNFEECSCKDEYIDPRLSKLKDFLK